MTEPANSSRPTGLRTIVINAVRTLIIAGKTNRRMIAGIAAVTVVVATAPVLAAYIGKLVIDGVLVALESGSDDDRMVVLVWVAAEAGALALLFASRRLLAFLKRLLHAKIGFKVGTLIHEKTTALDLETMERSDVQQQIVQARQYATSRPYGVVNRSFDTFQYTITLCSLSALLWAFSPWILALVVAAGLPLFIGELCFSSRSFRFYTGRTPEMRERNNLESLMVSDGPAMERIHSQSSEALRGRYTHLFAWLFGQDRAMQFRHTMIGLGFIGASSLLFISGQLWVAWTALLGAITLGQMTMFAALLRQGQSAVTGLFTTLNTSFEDLLYMAKLFDLLGLDEGRPRGSATAGPKPDDGYRLEDVSFSYPNGHRPALQNVTLHISHGIRLGIVGANGSGKTTLVKLLTGLYLPSSGRITLDGLDLADWDAAALYNRTAAMFQPFQRYNMTVADNIAIGDGFRTDDPDGVMDAAKRGFSDELVRELPDGLETKLSRQFLDGRELSDGQWQRLALSRAMIRTGAETLILDEPTAALDPETEASLISELEDPGHTTILISHRLSNLRTADRIIVFDEGRIVQGGTHDDLLDEDGLYRSMFEKQASFYR